jgi:purine nucleoside phosphorylase
MPEAALARELSIQYASISVVANWAAGLTGEELTMQQIELHLQNGMELVKKLIPEAIRISD